MPNDMTLAPTSAVNGTTPTPAIRDQEAVAVARLVPERIFAAKGSQKGVLTTLHLEAVRDHIAAFVAAQRPEEYDRSFSNMHLSFDGGRVFAQFLTPNGLGEKMLVHRTAYSQMSSNLLPNRGGSFLLDQAALGGQGEKLSTLSWATFARKDERPRMFRTVMTRDPADSRRVVRMLRSQHSKGYTAYDNLRFLNDLLDTAETRDLPVLQYHLSDGAVRIRFALKPGNEIELQKPTPMIEAWNSETAQRSVGMTAGVWKLICTNGLSTWEKSNDWRWRHAGNSDRISNGVRSAVEELRVTSNGVLTAYNSALDIAIDNAASWLQQELLREQAPASFTVRAVHALTDATTTPGGLLASAVDAVTLAAQTEDDLFAQAEYEAFAARILRRGLSTARNGRIVSEA